MNDPLYFAYGSNLCAHDLQEWCKRKGHDASGLCVVGIGRLPDHKIHFSHFSKARGGGALNVVPSLGHVAEGVLFKVDSNALSALDHKEGVPHSYRRTLRTVLDADGHPVQALVYVVSPEMDLGFVEPAKHYMSVVQNGLKSFGLCDSYLLAAANNQPVPLFTDRVFIYGTLMGGQCLSGSFQSMDVRRTTQGVIEGDIVNLGSYPGLLPGPPQGDRKVNGELVQLERIVECLPVLDEVEDFERDELRILAGDVDALGYNGRSLYVRRLVHVRSVDHSAWAWAYQYNQDVGPECGVIDSGCWRTATGT